MARQITIGSIVVDITASVSKLRANLTMASSLIRDWSLVAQGMGGAVTETFTQIASIGMRAIQIGALAVAGSFTLMAIEGGKFEDEMVRTFTLLSAGAELAAGTIEDLTDTARLLGRETLFSATQAAQGMQILARAGFSAREVISSIRPVLNLAIVGNLQMAESAHFVSTALRGFNLSTMHASRVADVLSVAMARSNTDVRMMGEALSYIAPVAAGAGFSIEETAAAVGLLGDAGIQGSRAGTTLRRAISVLMAPTGSASKIFKELGINVQDSSGELLSLVQILDNLKESGITTSQTMQAFGLRAGPGMVALLNRGSGALRSLEMELRTASGSAERMAQRFRTTVIGRVRDLIASIVDLGLAFSENFKKPLADAIFAIRNFIVELVTAAEKNKTFKAFVDGVVVSLKPFVTLIKEAADNFLDFIKNLTAEDVKGFFEDLQKVTEEWANTLRTALEKVWHMIVTSINELGGFETVINNLIKTIPKIALLFQFVYGIILKILEIAGKIANKWDQLPISIKKVVGIFTAVLVITGLIAQAITPIVLGIITWSALIGGIAAKGGIIAIGFAALVPYLTVIAGIALIIGSAIGGWALGEWLKDVKLARLFFYGLLLDIQAITKYLTYLVTFNWGKLKAVWPTREELWKIGAGDILAEGGAEGAAAPPVAKKTPTETLVGFDDLITNLTALRERGVDVGFTELLSSVVDTLATQNAINDEQKAVLKKYGVILDSIKDDMINFKGSIADLISKTGQDKSKGNTITAGSLEYD